MTDNEIIKALECCNHNHTWQKRCFDCEYATFEGNCGNELIKDTLDLINRQKAEIEGYKHLDVILHTAIDTLTAKIKSEAIREFAKFIIDKSKKGVIYDSDIPDYVKEMVGEDNG